MNALEQGSRIRPIASPGGSTHLLNVGASLYLAVLVTLSGCAHLTRTSQARKPVAGAPTPPALPTNQADQPCVKTTHGCISTNPDVTQATIQQTVCASGYSKSVRPATSYTNGVKRKLLREAGIDESRIAEYELDHLIPLAVGGHPRKLSNLMLQPWDGEQGAHRKDRLERQLQLRLCRGELPLLDAQLCIAEDWIACAVRPGIR